MKKCLLLLLPFLFLLSACTGQKASQKSSSDKKPEIITTFYPVYAMTKAVAGNELTVDNIVPRDQDVHEFEPNVREVAGMTKAKMVFYCDKDLEKWVLPVETKADKIEISKNIVSTKNQDPHSWLSPKEAIIEVKTIREALSKKFPKSSEVFQKNSENFIAKLEKLSQKYSKLKNSKNTTIVTQHGAFSYIARDYGLKQIAITGLTEDAEPSAQALLKLKQTLEKLHLSYVYFEKDMSAKVSQTVAAEAHAKPIGINTAETLTKNQAFKPQTYLEALEKNYELLERTLN